MKNESINICLGPKVRVDGRSLPAEIEEKIIKDLTFANPKFEKSQSMGFWSRGIPETIEMYGYDPSGAILLPVGYYPKLVYALKSAGLRFEVEDQRVAPPIGGTLTVRGRLYPYQERALADLLKYPTGVCEGVTGSGKTNVLLSAIPRLGTRTMILCHSRELMIQTAARCRDWLGYEPGQIGAGKETIKAVTLGMIQTLARRDLARLGSSFGAVLTDECHHVSAETWSGVVQSFHSKFKYGFSGTAWRKDGLTPIIHLITGQKTSVITREECEAAGKIVPANLEIVETSYKYDISVPAEWGHMLADLVADPDRNRLIADEAVRRLGNGSRILILTDRINHCESLGQILCSHKPIVIHGNLTKKERAARMTAVRQGAALTIATFSLMSEGVDVPGWEILFLATPISRGTRVLQSLGRVVRAAAGKVSATVVDIVDVEVPFLANAARGRQRLLVA